MLTGNYPDEPDPVADRGRPSRTRSSPCSVAAYDDERPRERHPALPEARLRGGRRDRRGPHAAACVGLRRRGVDRLAARSRGRTASEASIDFAGEPELRARTTPSPPATTFVRSLQPGQDARARLPPRPAAAPALALPPDGSGLRSRARAGRALLHVVTEYAGPIRPATAPAPAAGGRPPARPDRRPPPRSSDAYDDSLVVVTADHGVAFEKAPRSGASSTDNYHDVAWTPLFVKAPDQSARSVDDQPVAVDRRPADDRRPPRRRPAVEGRRPLRARAPTPEGPGAVLPVAPQPAATRARAATSCSSTDAKGFAQVLESQRPAGGEPELGLYRDGPYGHLVGTAAGPRVRARRRRPARRRPRSLRRRRPRRPCRAVGLPVRHPRRTRTLPLAVAVNGRVVAFSETFDFLQPGPGSSGRCSPRSSSARGATTSGSSSSAATLPTPPSNPSPSIADTARPALILRP